MPTPLKTLLKNLKLSEKEAMVYIASTRLGEATVQEIAHESKLPRTTVGSILDRLKELGYVTPQKEVPLYCDHGGVIVVEGERQGSRYNYPADKNKRDYFGGNLGIHYEVDFKEETTLGNTDLEDKLLPKSRVKSRNGENTGLFHIPILFRIESTTQPEGS